MVIKGSTSDADAVTLCLEDAVPLSEKENARNTINKNLKLYKDRKVLIRVNEYYAEDLTAISCKELDGIVLPKVRTVYDVEVIDSRLKFMESKLDKRLELYLLIETPIAVLHAYDLAVASKRVKGLIFGCEDYMADMDSKYLEDNISLLVPRSLIAIAAKAAGIESIDTPYVKMKDFDGLKRFATIGRGLGMTGMLAMSPSQVPVINECYSPSQEEIEEAKKIVNIAQKEEEEGRGIAFVDDIFLSPPTVKQARNILGKL